MPQLDLITFVYQFSGALLGLGLIIGILLWIVLPGIKTSRQARHQFTSNQKLSKSQKEPLAKKILQAC